MKSKTLVVADKAAKLEVDHRLPLRIYYRAADSLLRQARIYRKENNIIDLYVLLLRYSSLVMETIPQHRDYRSFMGREKVDFMKRLLDILNELEALKPQVQSEVSRYNNTHFPAVPSSVVSLPANGGVLPHQLYRSRSISSSNPVRDTYQGGRWTGELPSKPVESRRQGYSRLDYNLAGELNNRVADKGRQDVSTFGYNWTGDVSSVPIDQGRQEIPEAGYDWKGTLNSQSLDVQRHEYSQGGASWTGNGSPNPVYLQRREHYQTGSFQTQDACNLGFSSGSGRSNYASALPVVNSMKNLSLSIPSATSETLSRHSFMGSTNVRRPTQSNVLTAKVAYPNLMDASPIINPSLDQSWSPPLPPSTNGDAPLEHVSLDQADLIKLEDKQSSLIESAVLSHSQLIRQPSPPPMLAEVQTITAVVNHESSCTEVHSCDLSSLKVPPVEIPEDLGRSRKPKPLHIAAVLMEEFMGVAKGNTRSNLETCGVLAGSLKEGVFYVTTLIIPKQEGTSNSCNTTNEEELFEYQDKHDLFQFGWIHTHPSQSCFMSSIDLHTHYSYQVMLQEAVAIVMAPTDSSRKYGIFRLSEPSGLKTIQSCDKRGFHPHDQPSDGSPIYETSAHVLLDPKIPCDVVDLR